MKIKSKLLFGIGLLFTMITLLTFLSTFYVNKLSKESKNILLANYNSIEHCRQMLNVLNNGYNDKSEHQNFDKNLLLQQKNITEPGENELTQMLTKDFAELKNNAVDSTTLRRVQTDITEIMLINMEAIVRKDLRLNEQHLKQYCGLVLQVQYVF